MNISLLQLHMHKISNISTVSLSTRVEIRARISPKCSADLDVVSVQKPVQKWGQIPISCMSYVQWIYAWFPYQPGHNFEIPLCLVIMCFVLVDICEDLCRIRWKYLFLSDDHKEHFSLSFHWLGIFHNLPNSSWTFYSNPILCTGTTLDECQKESEHSLCMQQVLILVIKREMISNECS